MTHLMVAVTLRGHTSIEWRGAAIARNTFVVGCTSLVIVCELIAPSTRLAYSRQVWQCVINHADKLPTRITSLKEPWEPEAFASSPLTHERHALFPH